MTVPMSIRRRRFSDFKLCRITLRGMIRDHLTRRSIHQIINPAGP
jgi:hypothetical protein